MSSVTKKRTSKRETRKPSETVEQFLAAFEQSAQKVTKS